ncbi:glycosyltransferase family 2 protein [uncultured Pseudodesulfovibrio sp.]|uniref:glycosyltransferase family 2 protein n=1 Tax=uncultured Pseudodesulfovibrio sp. TaxID=2035858 RepID=UPI003749DB02
MNKVSIIIPAYNAGKFVENAIMSILTQDVDFSFEILIIDDNSEDDTRQVVSRLQDQYQQVKLLTNSRGKGPSGARNTGLIASTGEYVAFLDADDLWLQGHLRKGMAFFEKNPDVDVVFFDFDIVDYQSKEVLGNWFDQFGMMKRFATRELEGGGYLILDDMFVALVKASFVHLQSMIMRKSCAEGILFNESVMRSEDRDFNMRLVLEKGAQYAFCPIRTGVYHRCENSLTAHSLDADIAIVTDRICVLEGYTKRYGFSRPQRKVLFSELHKQALMLSYLYRQQNKPQKSFPCLFKSLKYGFSHHVCMEFVKICGEPFRKYFA